MWKALKGTTHWPCCLNECVSVDSKSKLKNDKYPSWAGPAGKFHKMEIEVLLQLDVWRWGCVEGQWFVFAYIENHKLRYIQSLPSLLVCFVIYFVITSFRGNIGLMLFITTKLSKTIFWKIPIVFFFLPFVFLLFHHTRTWTGNKTLRQTYLSTTRI